MEKNCPSETEFLIAVLYDSYGAAEGGATLAGIAIGLALQKTDSEWTSRFWFGCPEDMRELATKRALEAVEVYNARVAS